MVRQWRRVELAVRLTVVVGLTPDLGGNVELRQGQVAAVLHPLCTGLLRSWLADRAASEAWSLVRDRPRIERYLMPLETLRRLEGAGKVEVSKT